MANSGTTKHSEGGASIIDSQYVQNRCIKIVPASAEGVSAFKIEAPIKGKGLLRAVIRSDTAPDTFRTLQSLTTSRPGHRITLTDSEFKSLEKLGFFVTPDKAPQRVAFSCNVSDIPLSLEVGRSNAQCEWRINENTRIESRQESLANATKLWREVALLGAQEIVWIHDPCRHVTLPYWLNELEANQVRRLLAGEFTVNELDEDAKRKFVDIGLVYTDRSLEVKHRRWTGRFSCARRNLTGRGYAILPDLIPPTFLESIRQYYRRLLREGFLVFGDDQATRHNLHNEPFSSWLHYETESLISHAIPQPIKCSYSYVAAYTSGATLERHTDRIQCEYTLTLAIDATPTFARSEAWPLYIHLLDGQTAAVRLGPGDGLIMKGRELPHFRTALSENRTSSSLLFHYVLADFKGPLLANVWTRAEAAPE